MLRCSLGTTLARMGDAGAAIKGLQAAIRADPANPLARFELAGVLLGQERFQEALQELTRLRVSVPGLLCGPLLLLPSSVLLAGLLRGCTMLVQPSAPRAASPAVQWRACPSDVAKFVFIRRC